MRTTLKSVPDGKTVDKTFRAGEEHPTFVMTRTDAAHEEEIQKLGFRFMFEVSDGRPPNWKLFGHRREPPAPERPEP